MKKVLVSAIAALAMVVGGVAPAAYAAVGTGGFSSSGVMSSITGANYINLAGDGTVTVTQASPYVFKYVETYLAVCDSAVAGSMTENQVATLALDTPGKNCRALSTSSSASGLAFYSKKYANNYTLQAGEAEVSAPSSLVLTASGFYAESSPGTFTPVDLTDKFIINVTHGVNTSGTNYWSHTGSQQFLVTASLSSAPVVSMAGNVITMSTAASLTDGIGAGAVSSIEGYVVFCTTQTSASNTFATALNTVLGCTGTAYVQASVGGGPVSPIFTVSLGSSATSTYTIPESMTNQGIPFTTTNKYAAVVIKAKYNGSYGALYAASNSVLVGSATVGQTVTRTVLPVVPVFKQPKFAMPSKIDVDATGKVSLSGKDMGVSTVLIGGKEQKIDTNSDEKLVFDTTGLAKGVHDLVMKGAFGTYTIQKAIQVGEAVVTKVAAVSARQVGMAGGELSISGQGLEGATQITMNGQVLEIVSKTDSKVTFKVPASTVASVNSIKIEGSFVPVIFKNAFSYSK
jgi:hypothetical protein